MYFRTRRLLKRPRTTSNAKGAAHVASMLGAPRIKQEKVDREDSEMIVLDTTAEFCRQIGEEETFADTSE